MIQKLSTSMEEVGTIQRSFGDSTVSKDTARAALVCAGCAVGASLDGLLRFPGVGAAIFFLPYAVLTAALWRSRVQSWWLLLLASSLGSLIPHQHFGASLTFFAGTELANYARALVAAIGLRRYARRGTHFDALRDMVAYLVFVVGLGPAVGALLGAAVVKSQGMVWPFALVWEEWATSNAVTGVTFLSLFVMPLDSAGLRRVLRSRRLPEAVVLGAGLVVTGLVVSSSSASSIVFAARMYWPLPFLIWSVVRFGPRLTSLTLLGVSALAIWGALSNHGPLPSWSPLENLLALQALLLAIAVPFLLLSSLLKERASTAAELRDVQSRRSVEVALRDADRRKDEFMAMLGHELRNPLASIAVSLELVERGPLSAGDATRAIEAAGRQLRHVTRLVDDLLDTARIAHGKIQLRLGVVDLGCVLTHAIEVGTPLFEASGHELSVELPHEPVRVWGDEARLLQVLTNLFSNAAKFTAKGGHVRVALWTGPEGATISVRDDGVGISSDHLSAIFEPFTQVGAQSREAGGLGIGLTLAKQLVELHGGRLEASSDGEGKGAEFSIHLPVTDRAPEARAASAPRARPPRARRRVLVADDNVDFAEGVRALLIRDDHEVEVVHDGGRALEAIAAHGLDVVLLDINLPVVDGLEVARLIRGRYGDRVPRLIAVTGLGRPEDARRIAAVFDHHLVKPIDFDSLSEVIG
jgi:signal transduction histidine kinase/CheY-like chemotaxis protein